MTNRRARPSDDSESSSPRRVPLAQEYLVANVGEMRVAVPPTRTCECHDLTEVDTKVRCRHFLFLGAGDIRYIMSAREEVTSLRRLNLSEAGLTGLCGVS